MPGVTELIHTFKSGQRNRDQAMRFIENIYDILNGSIKQPCHRELNRELRTLVTNIEPIERDGGFKALSAKSVTDEWLIDLYKKFERLDFRTHSSANVLKELMMKILIEKIEIKAEIKKKLRSTKAKESPASPPKTNSDSSTSSQAGFVSTDQRSEREQDIEKEQALLEKYYRSKYPDMIFRKTLYPLEYDDENKERVIKELSELRVTLQDLVRLSERLDEESTLRINNHWIYNQRNVKQMIPGRNHLNEIINAIFLEIQNFKKTISRYKRQQKTSNGNRHTDDDRPVKQDLINSRRKFKERDESYRLTSPKSSKEKRVERCLKFSSSEKPQKPQQEIEETQKLPREIEGLKLLLKQYLSQSSSTNMTTIDKILNMLEEQCRFYASENNFPEFDKLYSFITEQQEKKREVEREQQIEAEKTQQIIKKWQESQYINHIIFDFELFNGFDDSDLGHFCETVNRSYAPSDLPTTVNKQNITRFQPDIDFAESWCKNLNAALEEISTQEDDASFHKKALICAIKQYTQDGDFSRLKYSCNSYIAIRELTKSLTQAKDAARVAEQEVTEIKKLRMKAQKTEREHRLVEARQGKVSYQTSVVETENLREQLLQSLESAIRSGKIDAKGIDLAQLVNLAIMMGLTLDQGPIHFIFRMNAAIECQKRQSDRLKEAITSRLEGASAAIAPLLKQHTLDITEARKVADRAERAAKSLKEKVQAKTSATTHPATDGSGEGPIQGVERTQRRRGAIVMGGDEYNQALQLSQIRETQREKNWGEFCYHVTQYDKKNIIPPNTLAITGKKVIRDSVAEAIRNKNLDVLKDVLKEDAKVYPTDDDEKWLVIIKTILDKEYFNQIDKKMFDPLFKNGVKSVITLIADDTHITIDQELLFEYIKKNYMDSPTKKGADPSAYRG